MRINMLYERPESRYGIWLGTLSAGFLSLLFLFFLAMPVQAVEFDLGFAQGSFNTQVSYGAAFRVEKRDSDLVGIRNGGNAQAVNTDDGNLNYDRGLYSNVFKVTSELDLYRENFGVFLRGSAFYDYENEKEDRERTKLTSDAKELVGSDIDMLDYYLWASLDIGSVPIQIRVGDQVVSWGESTFIQNSINTINSIDVSAIRLPGAELKEALMPEGMIWVSAGLTENLTVEAVYLYDWEETIIDPLGSYFSTNDYASPGGSELTIGNGMVPEGTFPYAVNRAKTKHASSSGQFGVAARFFVEQLNNSEFGLYFLNYHNRLPIISAINTTKAGFPAGAYYFNEYVEDIQLFGASFSTEIAGYAFQGEFSHRLDVPLQIDDNELLKKALGVPSQIPGTFVPGEVTDGYEELDVSQFQITTTKLTGPILGASQCVLLCEVGMTYIHDMPDEDELKFDTPGKRTNGSEQYADDFSWGYRALAKLMYLDAIRGINFFPRIAWKHDVGGNSPGPGGNFIAHRKAVTIGLGTTYQSWSTDLSYTNFFGAGNFNTIHDRDMIAFNIKYAF